MTNQFKQIIATVSLIIITSQSALAQRAASDTMKSVKTPSGGHIPRPQKIAVNNNSNSAKAATDTLKSVKTPSGGHIPVPSPKRQRSKKHK